MVCTNGAPPKDLSLTSLFACVTTAEKLFINDLKIDTIDADSVDAVTLEADNVIAENVTAEIVTAENLAAKTVTTENLTTENLVTENLLTENLVSENITAEFVQTFRITADEYVGLPPYPPGGTPCASTFDAYVVAVPDVDCPTEFASVSAAIADGRSNICVTVDTSAGNIVLSVSTVIYVRAAVTLEIDDITGPGGVAYLRITGPGTWTIPGSVVTGLATLVVDVEHFSMPVGASILDLFGVTTAVIWRNCIMDLSTACVFSTANAPAIFTFTGNIVNNASFMRIKPRTPSVGTSVHWMIEDNVFNSDVILGQNRDVLLTFSRNRGVSLTIQFSNSSAILGGIFFENMLTEDFVINNTNSTANLIISRNTVNRNVTVKALHCVYEGNTFNVDVGTSTILTSYIITYTENTSRDLDFATTGSLRAVMMGNRIFGPVTIIKPIDSVVSNNWFGGNVEISGQLNVFLFESNTCTGDALFDQTTSTDCEICNNKISGLLDYRSSTSSIRLKVFGNVTDGNLELLSPVFTNFSVAGNTVGGGLTIYSNTTYNASFFTVQENYVTGLLNINYELSAAVVSNNNSGGGISVRECTDTVYSGNRTTVMDIGTTVAPTNCVVSGNFASVSIGTTQTDATKSNAVTGNKSPSFLGWDVAEELQPVAIGIAYPGINNL